jgi:hypothetical protein
LASRTYEWKMCTAVDFCNNFVVDIMVHFERATAVSFKRQLFNLSSNIVQISFVNTQYLYFGFLSINMKVVFTFLTRF